MQVSPTPQNFFVAGGTLNAGAPSYVVRLADLELRKHIEAGELCYVLTTRQMGKSSLMARTAAELQAKGEGFQTVIIDLTGIGQAPIHQWYLSFLDELETQLDFAIDVEQWWGAHDSLSYVRRFTKFFHEVIPQEVDGRLVIFIDEIDSALNLDFADDFFAAIRSLYNRDSLLLQERRFSFVLLGVAAPDDLIKDRTRTPFNIGTRIELNELSLKDADVLLQGLPGHDRAILERMFYWTNGHPYLTQKLGQVIAQDSNRRWDDAAIDELVAALFFTDEATANESNLQFIRHRITVSPNKFRLLRLYKEVYRGKQVKSVEQSPYQNELKLYGLVRKSENKHLEVRNPIYREVFDEEWIKENTARDRWGLVAVAAIIVFMAVILVFWLQRPEPDDILAQSYITAFQQTENSTLRLSNLADLIALDGYSEEARLLFNELSTDEQVALFDSATPDLALQIRHVVAGIYTTLFVDDFRDSSKDTALILLAMVNALGQAQDVESSTLRNEIRLWLRGREHASIAEYQSAETVYDLVISDYPDNPATHLERALVRIFLEEYESAIGDLSSAWEHGSPWNEAVIGRVNNNDQLLNVIYALENPPPFFNLLPPPTPTATMTPEPTITPSPTPTGTYTPTLAPTLTPTTMPSPQHSPTNTSTRIVTRTPLPSATPTIPTLPPTEVPIATNPPPPINTFPPQPTDTVVPATPTEGVALLTDTPEIRPPTPDTP